MAHPRTHSQDAVELGFEPRAQLCVMSEAVFLPTVQLSSASCRKSKMPPSQPPAPPPTPPPPRHMLIHSAQEDQVRRNTEDCYGGGDRRRRLSVAVVTGQGGGCDVRHNLLARMVPGIGTPVLAGCLSPRWGLLAPQLPPAYILPGACKAGGPLLWVFAPGAGPQAAAGRRRSEASELRAGLSECGSSAASGS